MTTITTQIEKAVKSVLAQLFIKNAEVMVLPSSINIAVTTQVEADKIAKSLKSNGMDVTMGDLSEIGEEGFIVFVNF